MDRFTWHQAGTAVNEEIRSQAAGVCLYDGEEKTAFEVGAVSLTPFRLIWADFGDPNCRLSLHHSLILGLEKSGKSFMKSGKILLHLAPVAPGSQGPGPVPASKFSYVRLSFRQGHDEEFCKAYRDVLERKQWVKLSNPSTPSSQSGGRATPRTGIVGIERRMIDQHTKTAQNISTAFEDLSNLMDMARDMVATSKSISEKLKSRTGSISEDETVQFKSYLLSLGVDEPVTKEGSGSRYTEELAREMGGVLLGPLREQGGIITLADAFCRINRARGLELISPQDLLSSARLLESLDSPVRLVELHSGVLGLGLAGMRLEDSVPDTTAIVDAAADAGLDPHALAADTGISLILAKERLLMAERMGRICRDETVEGLRFFPNRFVNSS